MTDIKAAVGDLWAHTPWLFTKVAYPNLSDAAVAARARWGSELDAALVHKRDLNFTLFGFKTLTQSYLTKSTTGEIIERPQHMWMRVAVGIHDDDLDAIIKCYNLMSEGYATHATPTLFNAGTAAGQMSSCFLLAMKDDSIDGIFRTLHDCASISKSAGGIGLHIHNIRATGAHIHGTNGTSNGIVPMLRVFNNCARYVDQGGGRRKGSFAIWLEPWHLDIVEFLQLRKNTGAEEDRARDLFLGLWVNDLFMTRVIADLNWTLFCPADCPELSRLQGDEFAAHYASLESAENTMRRKTMKARDLWTEILASQVETGTPYIMFKDTCNTKSNQKNLGTIKSSNLCCEIVQYSDPTETAVCNLASVALPAHVDTSGELPAIDYARLMATTRQLVRNLNKIIDKNVYPTPECRTSNLSHRPIAIGVQGFADVLALLGYAFDDPKSLVVNEQIFAHVYYASLDASCHLAQHFGPYQTYHGSPASQGILQFDMWGVEPAVAPLLDWTTLRQRIGSFGLRNSLLTAVMPTASTAQILGNTEATDPVQSNLYSRRTLAGNFLLRNEHLVKALGPLWDEDMEAYLLQHRGSIADHPDIDEPTKSVFKTVWEVKQRTLVDLAAGRGPYIDQAQSRSLYFAEVTDAKLSAAIFYAWKKGLKTGMYYCRTLPKANATAFTACESCSA